MNQNLKNKIDKIFNKQSNTPEELKRFVEKEVIKNKNLDSVSLKYLKEMIENNNIEMKLDHYLPIIKREILKKEN